MQTFQFSAILCFNVWLGQYILLINQQSLSSKLAFWFSVRLSTGLPEVKTRAKTPGHYVQVCASSCRLAHVVTFTQHPWEPHDSTYPFCLSWLLGLQRAVTQKLAGIIRAGSAQLVPGPLEASSWQVCSRTKHRWWHPQLHIKIKSHLLKSSI